MNCRDICIDSRKAREGSLFFCIRGVRDDGHVHAREAYEAGCRDFCAEHDIALPDDARVTLCPDTRAALAEKAAEFFGYPAKSLITVGITGTKGKTGTAACISAILEHSGVKCGTIGTLGIRFCGNRYQTENTTPDAVTLNRALSLMVKSGVKAVAVEVSSQSLKEERVNGIEFDAGVFTNFSPDHVSAFEHADIDEYKSCKAKLFSRCRVGFFNADDAEYGYFVNNARCTALSYGTKENCAYRACGVDFYRNGESLYSGFDFVSPGGDATHIVTPVPGYAGIYNALCACSVCSFLGAGPVALAQGAYEARAEGRFELYRAGPAYVMIDYAHNEISVRNLFDAVSHYGFARKIAVFGCGGERSRARRISMGKTVAENADLCVITEDNPRDESLGSINADIMSGMKNSCCETVCVNDRREALLYAMREARENDIVLLMGKGHERYMEKNGRKLPFCEADIINEFKESLRDS
ncbi:MAG: UDP-N-acetylmuramoyl-L-alanyl-D-glutamate--2,6-diaminopimelate ligase [Clostridia bacterium]|nr:UDP-N-acetylmuramoyl-L-alanyl-D-glutamate--2,6-diaminopimelate ligase [Clostridia bacterium]